MGTSLEAWGCTERQPWFKRVSVINDLELVCANVVFEVPPNSYCLDYRWFNHDTFPLLIATSFIAPSFYGCVALDLECFPTDLGGIKLQLSSQWASAAIEVNLAKGSKRIMSITRGILGPLGPLCIGFSRFNAMVGSWAVHGKAYTNTRWFWSWQLTWRLSQWSIRLCGHNVSKTCFCTTHDVARRPIGSWMAPCSGAMWCNALYHMVALSGIVVNEGGEAILTVIAVIARGSIDCLRD